MVASRSRRWRERVGDALHAHEARALHQQRGSGLGLAVLPEFYIHSEVGGSAGVRVLDVSGWSETRSIAAAWRSGAAYAEAYRTIAGRIQQEARHVAD